MQSLRPVLLFSSQTVVAAEPGASIVFPYPALPAMPAMARAWNLVVTTYELNRENGFAQTADLVLSAVNARTRLVLVNGQPRLPVRVRCFQSRCGSPATTITPTAQTFAMKPIA